MQAVGLLKLEYEMVLGNAREFVQYEKFLSCKTHCSYLIQMMQSDFERKRRKARQACVQDCAER